MALMLAALALTLAQAPYAPASLTEAPTPEFEAPAPDWTSYLPVAASALVPGSGQMMQSEWGKGLLHMGFGAACLALTQYGSGQTDGTMRLVGGIGLLGIGLWSPWDALSTVTRPPEAPSP